MDAAQLEAKFSTMKWKYTFQTEMGENETIHFQGVLSAKNAIRFDTVKNVLERAHLEVCKDLNKSIKYCSKKDTRVDGPWSNRNSDIFKIKDPLDGKKLYPWQAKVLNILEDEADERTIYWIWEPTGNTGKTALCKSICINYEDAMYVSGKAEAVKFAIASCPEPPRIILWDVPRSIIDYVSWEGVENIKNGIFFSTKYESKQIIMDCPHVLMFANQPPPLSKLSEDRWKIMRVTTNGYNLTKTPSLPSAI